MKPPRQPGRQGRDNRKSELESQWRLADLMVPVEGTAERFVKSFPATAGGKKQALALGEALRLVLIRRGRVPEMKVHTGYRQGVGYGVWIVLGGLACL